MTSDAREAYRKDVERGLVNALYIARKAAFQAGQPLGAYFPEVFMRMGKQDEALQVL
jgi:hypothetical protein